ncbi:MAG: signal peptidase II [Collinsella sp.]
MWLEERLGNAIDRLMLGYVVDFIATDFIDFPVFNVADIGICIGVFFAFVGFMFLSPAAKVDATAELNARDEAAAARREKRRAERVRRARAASNAQGGDTARPRARTSPLTAVMRNGSRRASARSVRGGGERLDALSGGPGCLPLTLCLREAGRGGAVAVNGETCLSKKQVVWRR